MNIQTLQEFITLSKHLKVSSAAAELFISAPTLSQHITALEKELDLTLFDRKGGLSLTREGEEALDIAQHILMEYNLLMELSAQKEKRGRIRIPNYVAGLGELMQAKPIFLQEHPEYSLSIDTNELQMEDPFTILKEDRSDVSIVYLYRDSAKTVTDYAPADTTFSYFYLRSFSEKYFSAPDHPLATKDVLSLEDFDGATLLTTLCPLTTILFDSCDIFKSNNVKVNFLTRRLGRHDDIFSEDLGSYIVGRWAEVGISPAYDSVPLHSYSSDFDMTIDAYLVFIPEKLTSLQQAFLETVRELHDRQQ